MTEQADHYEPEEPVQECEEGEHRVRRGLRGLMRCIICGETKFLEPDQDDNQHDQ